MPNGMWDPLVPPQVIKPLQDKLDSPSLERGPWEARLRGFGAGALEGLRQQTTPANLAGLAANFVLPGVKSIFPAANAARGASGAVQGLSKVMPAVETLGEVMPEFTPAGGEGLYNLAKGGLKAAADPAEAAYLRILGRGGKP